MTRDLKVRKAIKHAKGIDFLITNKYDKPGEYSYRVEYRPGEDMVVKDISIHSFGNLKNGDKNWDPTHQCSVAIIAFLLRKVQFETVVEEVPIG